MDPAVHLARDFAQDIITKLKSDTTLNKELFAIRSAESPWPRDPFLASDSVLSDSAPQPSATGTGQPDERSATFVYSGFLDAGPRQLAIINGVDYAVGERVDDQGHYLRRILPTQIEIASHDTPGFSS